MSYLKAIAPQISVTSSIIYLVTPGINVWLCFNFQKKYDTLTVALEYRLE
ncbi:MAG: hypothetical protein AAGM46_14490 [Cyanobacteria bacterium J06582_2]